MKETAIDKLAANVVATRFDNFGEDIIAAAKYRIIDTLGCLIGGAGDTGNPELAALLTDEGGKEEATILVHGGRVPAGSAALINGAMARSLDFDPISPMVAGVSCPGHLSGTTVPTALAMAEATGASGRDMLAALIIGDDFAARLLAASGFGFTLGWDGTGTVNAFGAAAIAGRFTGLDRLQMRNAFGIVLNQIGSTFQIIWDATIAFKLPQGLSGRAGILSARLARAGWTGPVDPLFGKFGYYQMFTEGARNPPALTDDLGRTYYADSTIKPYPCCRITHAAIECALALVKKHAIRPDDIKRAELYAAPGAMEYVCGQPFKIGPFPHGNAVFSYQYTVGTALLYGAVRPEHFTEAAIRDRRINQFIGKIKLAADEGIPMEAARLTLTLKDGRELTEYVETARGDPRADPMTPDDIIAKFWMNVDFGGKISREKASELLAMLENLEQVDSVRQLIPLMVA